MIERRYYILIIKYRLLNVPSNLDALIYEMNHEIEKIHKRIDWIKSTLNGLIVLTTDNERLKLVKDDFYY